MDWRIILAVVAGAIVGATAVYVALAIYLSRGFRR